MTPTPTPYPYVRLAKAAKPSTVAAGETFVWRVTLSNIGGAGNNDVIAPATFTDRLPGGITFESSPGLSFVSSTGGGGMVCTIDSAASGFAAQQGNTTMVIRFASTFRMKNNGTCTYDFTVRVPASPSEASPILNDDAEFNYSVEGEPSQTTSMLHPNITATPGVHGNVVVTTITSTPTRTPTMTRTPTRTPTGTPCPTGGAGENCNWSNQSFNSTDWQNDDIDGSTFAGSSLNSVNFQNASDVNTNFSGATLNSVQFNNGNFTGANFANASLTSIQFQSTTLTGASFNGATLSSVDFNAANLTDVDFRNATLSSTTFTSATCTNVYVTQALTAANLNQGQNTGQYFKITTTSAADIVATWATSNTRTIRLLIYAGTPAWASGAGTVPGGSTLGTGSGDPPTGATYDSNDQGTNSLTLTASGAAATSYTVLFYSQQNTPATTSASITYRRTGCPS